MLKSEHRLRKQADIEAVYKHGKKGHHALVRLIYKTSDNPFSRLAVIVSKKTAKSAVVRNRIRRKLQGVINSRLSKLNRTYDIILIVQPKSIVSTNEELSQAIDTLFHKHQLYGI